MSGGEANNESDDAAAAGGGSIEAPAGLAFQNIKQSPLSNLVSSNSCGYQVKLAFLWKKLQKLEGRVNSSQNLLNNECEILLKELTT